MIDRGKQKSCTLDLSLRGGLLNRETKPWFVSWLRDERAFQGFRFSLLLSRVFTPTAATQILGGL